MICNEERNNFLISICPQKVRNSDEGFLLVLTAPPATELGALKVRFFIRSTVHIPVV